MPTQPRSTRRRQSNDGSQMTGEFNTGPVAGTAIVSGVTFPQKGLMYAELDGMAVFEGDIVLGPIDEVREAADEGGEIPQRSVGISAVVGGQNRRWPNATIPFEIDPALPNQQRVTDAIAHWQANTRIRFVARTAQHTDFVRFQPGGGCSSMVGRRGGMQVITLGANCGLGNTIHEIGHTVGLWHEQSREDRDRFIRIVWANIAPAEQHNFAQHIADGDDLGAYDFGSIMHYPATAFSINGQPTIVPLQPLPPGVVMGQRNGLSAGDIAGVHAMYPGPIVTIKEVRKDPIFDTIKEVRKDPIQDTIKEVRKDPIFDTVKEVRKDPIIDPIKLGPLDPGPVIRPTPVQPIVQPARPFVMASPSRAGEAQSNPLAEATVQLQELADAIAALEQQHAELMATYDAAAQAINDAQQSQ